MYAPIGCDLPTLLDVMLEGFQVVDRDFRYVFLNATGLKHARRPLEALVGRTMMECYPGIEETPLFASLVRCRDTRESAITESEFNYPDGTVGYFDLRIAPVPIGICVLSLEVTERVHGERALRASEERLRLALEGGAVGTWHWNVPSNELVWSDRCLRMFGIPLGTTMSYAKFLAALHPDDRARADAAVKDALQNHSEYSIEFRNLWPDGSVHWACSRGRGYYDENGQVVRMEGVAVDITDRKRAEEALRTSETRFRGLAESIPNLVWQIAPDGTYVFVNQSLRDYFGVEHIHIDQRPQLVHPDDLKGAAARWPARFADGTQFMVDELRLRRFDGSYRWFVNRSAPVRDAHGRLLSVVGTSTDIDDLKRAENALQKAQARLNAALGAAGMGTWVWKIPEDRVHCDVPLLRLFGAANEGPLEGGVEALLGFFHPDDRALLREALAGTLRADSELDVEVRIKASAAQTPWLACKGRVERDGQGMPLRFFGACVDITQRRRLEESLRQAQKMEALGQLAGGVAHDFNNLLTVIIGQASLMPVLGDLSGTLCASVDSISQAAERAAGLTSQLLAFGRRQLMQQQQLDLNQVVVDVLKMVRRIVGENVRVAYEPEAPVLGVKADANMLTQMLLNLTVNARDAMPRGGTLRVSTRFLHIDEREAKVVPEATAGDWVCLCVSDTGAGIPKEVLPHIFEPFFTTKDAGKGTGLGLSTVYGLVRQHHGFIHVDSDARGTTFQIFLPFSAEAPVSRGNGASDGWPAGRGETVLLVEDDDAVRFVVNQILTKYGYRVVTAEDGARALEVWGREHAAIDLLLTDIVMPGTPAGPELCAQLRAAKPSLKAILTSGYSAEAVVESTLLGQVCLLKKPYAADQLLRTVRETLEA